MTVAETISRVKWCIDHETREDAHLADGGEDAYMDNMIRAKIADARRWIAIVTGETVTVRTGGSTTETAQTAAIEAYAGWTDIGMVTLPGSVPCASLSRIRLNSWHKAAAPIDDTRDDALLMFDETAKGTADRPLATVMQGSPTRVLVQPYAEGDTAEIGYVGVAHETGTADGDTVDVAAVYEPALVYYIAYLLLSAYQDQRAQSMLAIAVQLAGAKQQ